MNAKILSLAITSMMLILIVDLVRRKKLTFKYASGWFLVLFGAMALAFFEESVFVLSRALGFELPSNFIFFAGLSGFVVLSLLMTIFLCQQNQRNDKVAQKLGLLEEELERLKKRTEG